MCATSSCHVADHFPLGHLMYRSDGEHYAKLGTIVSGFVPFVAIQPNCDRFEKEDFPDVRRSSEANLNRDGGPRQSSSGFAEIRLDTDSYPVYVRVPRHAPRWLPRSHMETDHEEVWTLQEHESTPRRLFSGRSGVGSKIGNVDTDTWNHVFRLLGTARHWLSNIRGAGSSADRQRSASAHAGGYCQPSECQWNPMAPRRQVPIIWHRIALRQGLIAARSSGVWLP
ncbi:hypothetical protein B0H11DRAFT_1912824 [Mycena galericulata]|nr:hypothetical protein B0H11DRAFT_1912824 [Mycena galericulata]